MSEHLKLQIAVLISNIIILALCVILAIAFNNWWIVFFSIFFFNGIKIYINGKEANKKR